MSDSDYKSDLADETFDGKNESTEEVIASNLMSRSEADPGRVRIEPIDIFAESVHRTINMSMYGALHVDPLMLWLQRQSRPPISPCESETDSDTTETSTDDEADTGTDSSHESSETDDDDDEPVKNRHRQVGC